MKFLFEQRAIIGALIWVGAIALSVIAMQRSFQNSPESMRQLAAHVMYQRKTVELDPQANFSLTQGTPVFLADSDRVAPIGIVTQLANSSNERPTVVTLYASSPMLTDQDHLEFHYAEDSIDWLVRTMFHPKKRDEIRLLIQDAYSKHHVEIMKEFTPVIKDVLSEAGEQIKIDLQQALESREEKLAKIGQRFQNDVIKEELIPLFQDEVWPIIESESEPLIREIGHEIWKEVSVFSFGWRYLYDQSPLPEKKLTEKKFREFVDQKAKPIIESHTDDFLELQTRIGKQVTENKEVRKQVSASLKKVLSDEEIKKLLIEVFREITIDNDNLKQIFQKQLRSAKANRAMQIANAKLDPVIRNIGVSLFGHPKEGITPEFAKVLRRRILNKDSSWLTLHLKDPDVNESLDRNSPFPQTIEVFRSRDDTSRPYAPASSDVDKQ
ncbi:MAG: hypothetical protein AAFN77_02150 [Planctomycetota bacterium]